MFVLWQQEFKTDVDDQRKFLFYFYVVLERINQMDVVPLGHRGAVKSLSVAPSSFTSPDSSYSELMLLVCAFICTY